MNLLDIREQKYQKNLRGKYVQFLQHIHDIVRKGEVYRLYSPLSAYWAITRKCNLRCIHCYAESFLSDEHEDMDIFRAYTIVDRLKDISVGEIVLEGGEPTCYQGFIPLIIYIKQKDIPITLLTNGINMSPQMVECVNKYFDEYDLIQLSLDGTKVVCDYIRGENTFDKVVKLIPQLKCHIMINCVATNENVNEIPELCNFLKSFGNIDSVHIAPLMENGKGHIHVIKDIENAISILEGLKTKYGDWISGTTVPDSVFFQSDKAPLIDMNHIVFGCCAGRSKIFINPEGKAYPCDFCQTGRPINLLEDNFLKEWNSHWDEQIKVSQSVSLEMKRTGKFKKYCPNMEVI